MNDLKRRVRTVVRSELMPKPIILRKNHIPDKREVPEEYFILVNVAATLIKLGLIWILLRVFSMMLWKIVTSLLRILKKNLVPTLSDSHRAYKISKLNLKQEESRAENFRKMVIAMAKIFVSSLVTVDRMHNMRTLQYVSEDKQKEIAQETLDIYVP